MIIFNTLSNSNNNETVQSEKFLIVIVATAGVTDISWPITRGRSDRFLRGAEHNDEDNLFSRVDGCPCYI